MDEQTEARAENSREPQKRERGLAALLRRAGLRIKNAFSKEKTIGKKRKKKRAVIACILVLVLAAGSFFGYRHFFGAEKYSDGNGKNCFGIQCNRGQRNGRSGEPI